MLHSNLQFLINNALFIPYLVAFLHSQPGTGKPIPEYHFSLLGATFMNLLDFRSVKQPIVSVAATSNWNA